MNWTFNGGIVTEIPDPDAYGFIYKITWGDKLYIGKKAFYSERNVKKGKKELAKMTDRRLSKKKKVRKESDWRTYQSSNEILCKVDPLGLSKEILMLCYSKTELTYQETKHLFVHGVLESDRYLNRNILSKFFVTK